MKTQTDHLNDDVLDNITGDIIVTDTNANILFWNHAAEETFGYTKGEIIGRPLNTLFDKNSEISFSKMQGSKLTEKWTMVCKDGSKISRNVIARITKDHQNLDQYVVISYTDSDQPILIEESCKHINAIAELMFTSISNAIITAAEDGTIRTVNPAACRMFGYSEEELLGENLKILMPFPFSINHQKVLHHYLINSESETFDKRREITGLKKDNSVFPIELNVGEVNIDGEKIYAGIIRDLSERRILERRLVEISKEERRRIGRDLHDGLGQTLTGIRMLSENLAKKMEAKGLPCTGEIQEIAEMIRDADELARSISRDMVHVDIEKRGLKVAIQELCYKTKKMTGVNCVFEEKDFVEFNDQTTSLHLYRIVQEAVNNAVKHAGPQNIIVRLSQSNTYISLTIDDDGCGFDASKTVHNGTGLQIMKHRAGVIGGGVEFKKTAEGLTRVRCIVPIMNENFKE